MSIKPMTTSAGLTSYRPNGKTFTTSGTITVTSGLFSGLNGTFNQAFQSQTNGNAALNGSIVYSVPNVSTVDDQFAVTVEGTGLWYGTSSVSVALQSGYTQTEKATYAENATQTIAITDGNSVSSSLNFFSDFSGTGKITGADPGLPATLSWDDTGSGKITYSNGSTAAITKWILATG